MAEDRQHGEQQAGADRGDDDGARDVALRVAGFLGQGRDRVEAEERQAQHRRAGHQRGEARLAAVADEGQAQVQRGDAGQVLDRHGDEHHGEDELGADDHVAHAGHRADADHVEHGDQADRREHEDPGRHHREGDVEEQADEQVVDHRQEQVVEQQRPAGEEADAGAEAEAGIGIGRAGDGIFLHHEAVGKGGEEHRRQGDQVGAGGATAGDLGDYPVGGEHGQRNHVDQPEEDQGGEPEDAPQAGALGAVDVLGALAADEDAVVVLAGHVPLLAKCRIDPAGGRVGGPFLRRVNGRASGKPLGFPPGRWKWQ